MVTTSTFTRTAHSDFSAPSRPVAGGYYRAVSSIQRLPDVPDDDDEIVWPITSQTNTASNTPVPGEAAHAAIKTGRTSLHNTSLSGESNDSNMHTVGKSNGHAAADSFPEDIVLERGDLGSKIWTPPPSVQRPRPRGRGHRSTRSESAVPVAPVFYNSKPAGKQLWADDVNGLEEQMTRTSLAVPASSSEAQGTHSVQDGAISPRKQRSQKKQKGKRPPRARSVPNHNNRTAAARSYPSPASSPSPIRSPPSGIPAVVPKSNGPGKKKPKKVKGRKNMKSVQTTEPAPPTAPSTPRGFGTRSVVDDISENGDEMAPPQLTTVYRSEADRLFDMAYDEAVKFMNAFIQNPDFYTSRASRLTFLQALIVELGLVSANGPERSLPGSLTAAKALLKTHVFVNVKDYLAVREKGLDALQSVMRPSRSALVKDLRGRNGRRAELGWVKETGLNVLLVPCQY